MAAHSGRAAAMADHACTGTTQLYDRRSDEVTPDEVDRVPVRPGRRKRALAELLADMSQMRWTSDSRAGTGRLFLRTIRAAWRRDAFSLSDAPHVSRSYEPCRMSQTPALCIGHPMDARLFLPGGGLRREEAASPSSSLPRLPIRGPRESWPSAALCRRTVNEGSIYGLALRGCRLGLGP